MTNFIDWVVGIINKVTANLGWLGPLAVRVVVGIAFMLNGWGKLHNLPGITDYFTQLHIPAPGFNAVLVASTEFVGGMFLIVGLLTRFASVALLISMVVATITAQLPENVHGIGDFVNLVEVTYGVIFLWLAVAGAGRASVDHVLAKVWANRGGKTVTARA